MSREKRHILIALAIAFVARLAMYPFAGIEDPLFYEYGEIASRLINGEGYSMVFWIAGSVIEVPSAWMPPGQTLITALFFWAFGIGPVANHLIFVLNALLGTAAAFTLGEIVAKLSQYRRSKYIALYAAGLFPPFISASSTWGVASSVLFLNSLLIYAALRLSQAIRDGEHQMRAAWFFGLISGVLALFRSEAPLMVGFIMAALLYMHRKRLFASIKYIAVSGSILCSFMAPWTLINHLRFDAIVLGSTSGGFNLWRGNNPMASGGGWTADGTLIAPSHELHTEILEQLKGVEPNRWERAYSAELTDRAWQWMQENPLSVLTLAMKKVLLIWILDPYHPKDVKYVYAFFQLIAFGLACVGLSRLRGSKLRAEMRSWLWIAGAACLASTLITMVFFSLPRYQIFLVGIYFPMVALGVEDVLMRWEAKRQKSNLPATEFAAN